jgi:hypothetical protein
MRMRLVKMFLSVEVRRVSKARERADLGGHKKCERAKVYA